MSGEVRVDVLDEAGATLAASKHHTADSTKLRIEWADCADLSACAGRAVRLRFSLGKGALYSFWVTTDGGGASNGYVGAGGPAFDGVRDVVTGR